MPHSLPCECSLLIKCLSEFRQSGCHLVGVVGVGNRMVRLRKAALHFQAYPCCLLLLSLEVNSPVGLPDSRGLEEIRQKVTHPDRDGMLDLNLLFNNTVRFL